MAEKVKGEKNPIGMTPEELMRLAQADNSTFEGSVAGMMKDSTPKAAKVAPEKLFNKKYYRTVNIDVAAEEKKPVARDPQKGEAEDDEKTSEDYKVILRGMGFKV